MQGLMSASREVTEVTHARPFAQCQVPRRARPTCLSREAEHCCPHQEEGAWEGGRGRNICMHNKAEVRERERGSRR